MAHLSSKFVLKRARALRKVQESVKRKWAWDEKSLADWDGAIQGVEDQQAVETNSKAALKRRSFQVYFRISRSACAHIARVGNAQEQASQRQHQAGAIGRLEGARRRPSVDPR